MGKRSLLVDKALVSRRLRVQPEPAPSPWRARLTGAALVVWATLGLVVVGTLMVGHWVVLPKPAADDPRLQSGLDSLRGPGDGSRWLAVHVLYAECPCSQRVLEHLVTGERPSDLAEALLLVGEAPEERARAEAAGFSVINLTPQELSARYGIESAPALLVVDPRSRVRYVGGYTERRQGFAIRDRELIAALRAEGTAPELPLYGCGVSAELQDVLDPLRLKYDRGGAR